jgi:pentatricopeptide repeat protein
VYEDMKAAGFTPRLLGSNALIRAYADAGELELAREAFDFAREAGLLPSDAPLKALAAAAGNAPGEEEPSRPPSPSLTQPEVHPE